MFYDLFIEPLVLCRVSLLRWLAGSDHHLQSTKQLDQWNPLDKHSALYSIYPVPETIRGF